MGTLALLLLFASISGFLGLASGRPMPLENLRSQVQNFGVGAVYHVFPTMQTQRQELIVEGSNDGRHWREYVFRYKLQRLDKRPAFIVPHQPRLDWMMWFVPTQHPEQMFWFGQLLWKLKQGSSQVLSLFAENPFPDGPPEYLRVTAWKYRFTTPAERWGPGNWWAREYLGVFPLVPPRRP